MTPDQCRAARAMLNLDHTEVADRSGVACTTIIDFEQGRRVPQGKTLAAIRAVLEAAGVVFLDPNGNGPGVGLRKTE